MSVIDVINCNAEKVSEIELKDEIFNVKVKSYILNEVVKNQLAAKRSGTASVKNRSDVRGSQRKLFRQKGTGRARRGNIKAPLLRGGGVAFGPSPKTYTNRVPKKVKKLALKMALSSKLRDEKIFVLDRFQLDQKKTKDFVQIMKNINIKNALIVANEKDENFEFSSRNMPNIKSLRCEGINVYDILKYENLIILESAIEPIEGRLL